MCTMKVAKGEMAPMKKRTMALEEADKESDANNNDKGQLFYTCL